MKFNKWIGTIGLCIVLLLTGCGSQSQITQLDDKYKNVVENKTTPKASDTVDGAEQTNDSGKSQLDAGTASPLTSAGATEQESTKATPDNADESDKTATSSPDSKNQKTSKATSAAKSTTSNKSTSKKKSSKKESSSKTKKSTSSKSTLSSNESKSTSNDTQSAEANKATAIPTATPKPAEKTCTISIDCKTILSNKKDLNSAKVNFVPADGVILKKTEVALKSNDTAYDILARVCKSKKIHLESDYTPAYKTYYVKGINQLYEMDCGDLSGWAYKVNGVTPNYGASKYTVKEGDHIEWRFSCNAGKDVE